MEELTRELTKDNTNFDGVVLKDQPWTLEDDYLFWINQMGEHGIFLASAMDEPTLKLLGLEHLKKAGYQFYADALDMFKRFSDNPSKQQVRDTIKWLDDQAAWEDQLLKLTFEVWHGYNYPKVIHHYHQELNYFRARLEAHLSNKTISSHDELHFWTDIVRDHVIIIDKLLDPTETNLSNLLHNRSQEMKQVLREIKERHNVVEKSIQSIRDAQRSLDVIDEILMAKDLASVIQPALLSHIIREDNRALSYLEASHK